MTEKYPMEPGQERFSLPLSFYRRVGETIYVSGHGAVNEKGEFAAPDFEGQFHYTMELLQKTLEEAGTDLSHVVMVRGYVQDPKNLPLYNALYRTYFKEPRPARTTVVRCLPDGLEFEIDCVAFAKRE